MSKKVAVTVLLTLADESKRFLVKQEEEKQTLLSETLFAEETGLARALHLLKEEAQLDLDQIELVDLTNGSVDHENIPIFVFETNVEMQTAEGYVWVTPSLFRTMMQDYAIEGMPFF